MTNVYSVLVFNFVITLYISQPEHDVRLTSVAEEGSAVTAHVGQGDMTNLKVNLTATVHGSPLAFSIDGKHYVLTDSGDYSLLDNGKGMDAYRTTQN